MPPSLGAHMPEQHEYEDFARLLRIALGAADISVGAMAQSIGVTKGKVLEWTQGRSVPPAELLQAIEERLGVPESMLSGALDRSRRLTRGVLELPGTVLRWVGLAEDRDELLVGFPTRDGGIDLVGLSDLTEEQRARLLKALVKTG